jgi:flagellar biogenesis protein FliO
MGIFSIAMSVLFAWIIKRLVSRSARAEFGAL